ncbi:LPS biosynthesis protein [Candidatus Peregrinibacteria bacterium CG1_02_54_53]|nr:MAG: LPS biosynthesis protein [Candidatus Peregrinibacteria bacterium CG1_02_54_53]
MQYCKRCTYPIIAVNLAMRDDGVCSGCDVTDEKSSIDWKAREEEFRRLLEEHRSKDGSNYDCIIPVSGGKDSHFQVWYITKKLGLKPLLVTYYTHNYTETAEQNLRNISRAFGVDHYIFTPSLKMVSKMNIAGFRKMGDMSWHFHCGVWTLPFQVAVRFNIPLVIYGEHGFLDLAGQYSLSDRPEFTVRDRKESYLRGYDWNDFVGDEGLTEQDLLWAKFPPDEEIARVGVRGIHLGVYTYWDGNANAKHMQEFGFKPSNEVSERTYRTISNVDDIHENGIKDWLKFVKFGYGRCTDHTSKDIRLGVMTREQGIELVRKYDHVVPRKSLEYFLSMTGMKEEEFFRIADTFHDPRVWWIENGEWWKDNPWGEPSSYGPVHLPKESWVKYEKKSS